MASLELMQGLFFFCFGFFLTSYDLNFNVRSDDFPDAFCRCILLFFGGFLYKLSIISTLVFFQV